MKKLGTLAKVLIYSFVLAAVGFLIYMMGEPGPPPDELVFFLRNSTSSQVSITVALEGWSENADLSSGQFTSLAGRGLATRISVAPGEASFTVASPNNAPRKFRFEVKADGKAQTHWLGVTLAPDGHLYLSSVSGLTAVAE